MRTTNFKRTANLSAERCRPLDQFGASPIATDYVDSTFIVCLIAGVDILTPALAGLRRFGNILWTKPKEILGNCTRLELLDIPHQCILTWSPIANAWVYDWICRVLAGSKVVFRPYVAADSSASVTSYCNSTSRCGSPSPEVACVTCRNRPTK